MPSKYFVTAIGNAIIDVLAFVEDDFLEQNFLKKGSMTLVQQENVVNFANLKFDKISSGGSAANTVVAMSAFGIKNAFIGNIGSGHYGDMFHENLTEHGVDFYCKHKTRFGTTARSFILITPDKDRTMCTFLGEASNITNEIDGTVIANSDILFVEGYLWDQEQTIKALKRAMLIAKENKTKIAFSLSDVSCIAKHRSDFLKLTRKIDILVCNEAEINSLVSSDSIDQNKIKALTSHNEDLMIIVTRSEKGVIIFNGRTKEFHNVPAIKTQNVVDATGAGDAFVAGLFYGLDKKLPLEEAARVGHLFASNIIQKVGGRFDEEEISKIKEQLKILPSSA